MPAVRAIAVALLITHVSGCARPVAMPPARPLNILLVTIDTLRADRVSQRLTPTLDGLASRGLRFTNARTTVPLTLPAHTSIMTGRLPPIHGTRVNGAPVRAGQHPIAARLSRAGYRTAAAIGAFVLDRRFGLAEGFDHYDDAIARNPDAVDQLQAERRADSVIDAAIAWLGGASSDRPWFLWVHLFDPHTPYDAPNAVPTNGSLAGAYDQEVAFADAEIGRLLSTIAARADAPFTAVMAAGDHGESLGEHGELTHGMLLFDPALRVPLIVSAPGTAPALRHDPVSILDIMPSVLALAGLPADASLPGRNLLGGPDPDLDREIYAETEYPTIAGWHPARALVYDRWKLTVATRARLFDVTSDHAEGTDVAASHAALVQGMQKRIEELGRADAATPVQNTIDAGTAARLRALGYVSPAATPRVGVSGTDAADVIADWARFEQALNAENAGRPQDAASIFATLAEKYPEGAVFQSSYGRALLRIGRSRDAVAIYKRAVARWPADATMYHDLAVAARASGDAAEAARAENAALTLSPELPSAHNGRGLLYTDDGRHADAARAFQRAAELDPTNGSYMANLGNARRAMGELDAAAQAYRLALERDPALSDAANGLGVILVQQRRAADAVRYLEQAVARDPAFVEAQLNLGIALHESGQRERALVQYRLVERTSRSSRERDAARTLRRQLERR